MDLKPAREEPRAGPSKESSRESVDSDASQPCEPNSAESNVIHTVDLFDVPIVALNIDGRLRLCLAQISSTLLKSFSYNEIHNRRVALGINCVQCTPVQLEMLRRAGAMPISSRRCGMITKREAERLVKSFLYESKPPALPDDFTFQVFHQCAWGCKGRFVPSRYNSSRAKCIQCIHCQQNFSPNKFIFHSHKLPDSTFSPADAANFNSWRRHIHLDMERGGGASPLPDQVIHAWEDVKAMFNGGSRRRISPPTVSPAAVKPYSRRATKNEERTVSPQNQMVIPKVTPFQPEHPLVPPAGMYAASFMQPGIANPIAPYDWLYGQPHGFAPYNFWMQRALQQARPGEAWPNWYHPDFNVAAFMRNRNDEEK